MSVSLFPNSAMWHHSHPFCCPPSQLTTVHEQLTALSEAPVIKQKKKKENDKKEDVRQNKGTATSKGSSNSDSRHVLHTVID